MLELLGDLLEPYSDVIATFAGIVTCLQFFSGVFFLNDIRKKGSADDFPAAPFLGGIALTVLSIKYGSLVGDSTMIKVNFIGFVVNFLFMTIFFMYTSATNRPKIWGKIAAAGIFISVCLTYAKYENPEVIEFRFGMLITTILVLLVGSPLLETGEIIKKQSAENLPIPMIISGFIVSSSWMAYGISIRNELVTYQNAFLLLLSSAQLLLIVIYPTKPSKKQQTKLGKKISKDVKKD